MRVLHIYLTKDAPDDRRFHLSFKYANPEKGWENTGNEVIQAPDLESAARQIARNRNLKTVTITKRHFSGKGANESETINRTFHF